MDEITKNELTFEEILMMSAQSGSFFSRFFLSKTFSLSSPVFHEELWGILENPEHRYVCVEVFRDGAKTTITRAFTLKSICFATCKLILFLSESRAQARTSVEWIAQRIRESTGPNSVGKFFGLKVGKLDNRDELEIENHLYGTKIRIIAAGADSQVRGYNIDDDRPDLIVADDFLPGEVQGTTTLEATVNKFFGAVVNSLAAKALNPFAKIVNLATRTAVKDIIGHCELDKRWVCVKFSVFDANGESVWPSKWSTEDLKNDKAGHAAMNKLSVWLREKECKLVTSETTTFKSEWLTLFNPEELPDGVIYFIGLDPVPPPSDEALKKGLKKKDWECFTVLGFLRGYYFIVEQTQNKGHEIDWTLDEFFHLINKYRPKAVGIESVAYQRTIAKQLREQMRIKREYTQVYEILDGKRSKFHRITDEISPLAQNGFMAVSQSCTLYIQQFTEYPGVEHDDHLDSAAISILTAKRYLGGVDYSELPNEQPKSPFDLEYEKLYNEQGGTGLCP